MTAYLQSDEILLVNASGIALPVTASQQLPSGTSGIVFAGVNLQNQVEFAKIINGSLQVSISEPVLSEVGLYAENITGSMYFMAVDLSNVSSSYKHDQSMLTGIRVSSLQGNIEKTHAQDKWKVQLGICLSTSTTGSTVSWLSVGAQSLSDTLRFHSSIDFSQKNIVDLTVQSGSLVKLANNYKESLIDLTAQTILDDVEGRDVNVEPGDLVLRVKRLSNHGGSLSFHYHLWYKTKD